MTCSPGSAGLKNGVNVNDVDPSHRLVEPTSVWPSKKLTVPVGHGAAPGKFATTVNSWPNGIVEAVVWAASGRTIFTTVCASGCDSLGMKCSPPSGVWDCEYDATTLH